MPTRNPRPISIRALARSRWLIGAALLLATLLLLGSSPLGASFARGVAGAIAGFITTDR